MGIDVWFERPLASEIQAGREKVAEAVSLPTPATNARRVSAMNAEQVASVTSPVAVPVAFSIQEVQTEEKVKHAEGKAPVEPFVLACVRGSGAVLLTRGPLLKNQQRMARDIVLAVMRIHRASPAEVQVVDYRYPPAADLGASRLGAPDRALRAFLSVQRQGLTDNSGGRDGDRGGLILITENAHSLFKDWLTEPHSVIADLASLAGDAAQKRALWLRLNASV
jgi:hypothetical protein